jgi:hypothetical protein
MNFSLFQPLYAFPAFGASLYEYLCFARKNLATKDAAMQSITDDSIDISSLVNRMLQESAVGIPC